MSIIASYDTEKSKYIPIVGTPHTGPPKEFIDAGYPADYGVYCGKILREGHIYGLRFDEKFHRWIEGDAIVLDPEKNIVNLKVGTEPHKEVLLRKKNSSEAKIVRLKKLINETWEETWEIEDTAYPGATQSIAAKDIEFIHPIIAVIFPALVIER